MSGTRRRPAGSPGLLTGAAFAAVLLVLALASLTPWLAAGLAIDVERRLLAPSLAHCFGTDPLGRDVLAMVAAGTRTSLGVALASVTIGVLIGVPLGLVAAARGGIVDDALARLNDVVFAFPSLLLAVLLSAALGPGALTAILAIGLFNVPVFARLVRGNALSLMTRDFVLAARLAGRGSVAIALDHLLPNVAGVLIAQTAIQLSLAIVAEAGLAYVGLGAQPPAPSWGRMLNEAQTLVGSAPWLVWFPGLALSLAVLAFGLIGERLSTLLDPRGDPGRRR